MQSPNTVRFENRRSRFERFEERLALSGQPAGSLLSGLETPLNRHYDELTTVELPSDFLLETVQAITSHDQSVNPLLSSANQTTGVEFTHSTYGFSGVGQTVAIIDSGIAYDHLSLGAGYGAQHRVVGGYDFAENDANPYDDGPAGFHGTHVAGIVGSDHAVHRGVAPGVDLVALRVFDDEGAGYFSWVESALAWVHEHRNDFENPITTVNLSLGSNWNSDSIPGWAALENEFAQLEADGIFISASAGNSFETFDAVGLSYPAASPNVVPVASVDDDGSLSYFSQRNSRVLAAPGETITSTVPDHVFGSDGVADDFGSASGTSMAAPYLAGASVLVRQAMEFVGTQVINQDTIYDHLRNTADVFFDDATNANYHRLNLQAAIAALMPADDFGSSIETAHNLGMVSGDVGFSGLIGQLADVDYFTFTAGATGTLSMTATGNHELSPEMGVIGATGSVDGDVLSFNVVAGQTYSVTVETADGIGFYDANLTLESTATDLGAVDFRFHADQALTSAETWFQLTATRDGLLTVEAFFDEAAGSVSVQIFDSADHLLGTGYGGSGTQRIDVDVSADATYLVRLAGVNDDVDLRLTNLVSENLNVMSVAGTAGDDIFVVDANEMSVTVKGVSYTASASTTRFDVDGQTGQDTLILFGSDDSETATVRVGSLDITSSSYELHSVAVEDTDILGRGGNDTAVLHDSAGNDFLLSHANAGYSFLQGAGFRNVVRGFESVEALATTGYDRADFYDSAGDDQFVADAAGGFSRMQGTGYSNRADGFDTVIAYASAGGDNDVAEFFDSAGDDRFVAHGAQRYNLMTGSGLYHLARGFDRAMAYADAGGHDQVNFYDSAGDDLLTSHSGSGFVSLESTGYYHYAQNFELVVANAGAGGTNDQAVFHDSSGDDRFIAHANHGYRAMQSDQYYHIIWNFHTATAHSSAGGADRAQFYDSTGSDTFIAHADHGYSSLSGAGFYFIAHGFGTTEAYAGAGGALDRAEFYDSIGNDRFVADAAGGFSYMEGDGFYNYARGFDESLAYAGAGGDNDRVEFFDSAGDDHFEVLTQVRESSMQGTGYLHSAQGFDDTFAHSAHGGNDQATLRELETGGQLVGIGAMADYTDNEGSGTMLWDFDLVEAEASANNSPSYEVGAVDYVFDELGD